MRRWWEDPGMTRPADVAEAAKKAGVYLDLREDGHVEDGQRHGVEDVPMVVVRAHGGPWILYPDPATILGWVAEQIEYQPNGDITVLDGTTGWVGTGDLAPDQIIANLVESSELPTDLWMNDPPVSTAHLRPDHHGEQTDEANLSRTARELTPGQLADEGFPLGIADTLAANQPAPPSTPGTPGNLWRTHGTSALTSSAPCPASSAWRPPRKPSASVARSPTNSPSRTDSPAASSKSPAPTGSPPPTSNASSASSATDHQDPDQPDPMTSDHNAGQPQA
jgi:hypothetical protein